MALALALALAPGLHDSLSHGFGLHDDFSGRSSFQSSARVSVAWRSKAGTVTLNVALPAGDPAEWDRLTAINQLSPMHITRWLTPPMVEKGAQRERVRVRVGVRVRGRVRVRVNYGYGYDYVCGYGWG